MFLTLSLSFIIPYQIGQVYGADATTLTKADTSTKAEIASTCSLVPPANPKDSLVMSVVTLCLPGVLEKAKQWKDIKCEEVVCSYEAVKNSLSPGFCAKEAGYKVCTYVVGEIFAIPPMSIVESLKEKIASIIANPAGFVYSVAIGVIRKQVATMSCKTPISFQSVVLGINDIAAGTKELKDMIDNGFSFNTDETQDYCSQMGDIVEELETIIKLTNTSTSTNTTP